MSPLQKAKCLMICTEVTALQGVAEIRGVVFVPMPVAAVVERSVEVRVPVFQFGEHIGEDFEELVVVHRSFRAYIIYIIDGVPVEAIDLLLVVKKTVVLINHPPQRLKIPLRRIFMLDSVDA